MFHSPKGNLPEYWYGPGKDVGSGLKLPGRRVILDLQGLGAESPQVMSLRRPQAGTSVPGSLTQTHDVASRNRTRDLKKSWSSPKSDDARSACQIAERCRDRSAELSDGRLGTGSLREVLRDLLRKLRTPAHRPSLLRWEGGLGSGMDDLREINWGPPWA